MKTSVHRLAVPPIVAFAALLLAAPHSSAAVAATAPLRVCADPDYMPFSNRAGEGFENKIAEFVAKSMGRPIEYTWASYRAPGGFSNFLAENLDAKKCDVVVDLPYGDVVDGYTSPYYISSYVFVRKKAQSPIHSMRSPALRAMKIGFEAGTAPEVALKIAGLTENAVPFHVADSPTASPKSMRQAVEDGKIGVMITWEPAIGYFLKDYANLTAARVPNEPMGPGPPAERFTFVMAMGVRQDDATLKNALDAVVKAKKPQLDAILARYDVKLYSSLAGQTGFGDE
jgi:mxaJ protein